LRGDLWQSVTQSIVSPESTTTVAATSRAGFRPGLANVADKLAGVADRVRQLGDSQDGLIGEVKEFVQDAIGKADEALDLDFARVDRAFEDLFSTRRRQQLLAELQSELPGDEDEADAAFAALADHFDWPRG
jgi:hypothetical protein